MHHFNPAGSRAFPRRFLLTVLCLGIALLSPFASAEGASTRSFDLPAQSAESALKIFSNQSGQGLIMNANTVAGIQTKAVKGDFTPADALAQC